MGRVLIKGIVKRQNGFLYFIDANGNLCVSILDETVHLNKKWAKIHEKQLLDDEYDFRNPKENKS